MKVLLSAGLLGLAWLAAINAVLTLLAWLTAYGLLRRTEPVPGAGVPGAALLAVRLLPAAGAALFVAAGFLPAHVWLEPANADESFGAIVIALSAAGVILAGRALWRAGRVLAASRAVARLVQQPIETPCGRAYAVAGFNGVSLAGVLRTRVIVGERVRRILTDDELREAVAHEQAHRAAFDNAKRCAMYCAADLFGATAAARALEDRWRAQAEWLADARAAAGASRRALHLASALVKVARQCGAAPHPLLSRAWSTFHEPALLETRVRRLVSGSAAPVPGVRWGAGLAAGLVAAGLAWNADALTRIHEITEALILRLP